MVVATGATDAQSEEGLAEVVDDLIERVLSRQALRGFIPADLSGQEHRRRDEEAGRDVLSERIADDLLLDEPVVRGVLVEGADHVVAVRPGVRSLRVDLEAVGVGVADDVEPMLAPMFAVTGRGEEPLDGRGAVGVSDEGGDFLGGGRKSGEVEARATEPRAVRGRRRPV